MTVATNRRTQRTGKKKRKKKRHWLTAATSDPYVLYERSVQEPEAEVDFIDQVWKERRKRAARLLREDFCGTAIASCAWIKRRRDNTAIGVDIDPKVLQWARDRLPDRLAPAQRKRLTLIEGDVMNVKAGPVDSVLALNFSYFLFKTRPLMKKYFRRVYDALVDDGIFFLDAYGGSESFEEMEEERDCDGFTYVWDQHRYDPITGDAVNKIHFRFPDGSEIRDAFEYEWRLWTLPEIQELLDESGFRNIAVYWEGTDEKTGEGDGVFTRAASGDACPGWIAYIVGEK